MKTNDTKKALMFGDLIDATFRARGARKAKGFLRLVVNAGLVIFTGRQRFVISDD